MKKRKEIISGFIGLTIGVCGMMIVNPSKQIIEIEKDVIPYHVISENINTCEDIIEWMNYDKENYADSTVFDSYIWNLEDMIEDNRNLIKKIK